MGASVWNALNLSWRRPLLYRNQSIDLLCKSIDWFLYDRDRRHERVKGVKLKQWRKKRLRHRCFSVNITKFLITPFFIEHHRWLLLSHSLVFYRLSCSENFRKVHMKASVKRTPSQAFSWESFWKTYELFFGKPWVFPELGIYSVIIPW